MIEDAFGALLSEFRAAEGEPPADGGWQGAPGASPFHSYVMWSAGEAPTDGPLAHPDAWSERSMFTTCVAATPEGARLLASLVADAVSGQRLTVDGRTTTGPITIERHGPVDRDDTVRPPVWIVVNEFRVDTTAT